MTESPIIHLNKDAQRHAVLICFIETILCTMANEVKPKSRRHNQFLALIERLKKLDETYHGTMPDEAFACAQAFLEQMERHIIAFLEGAEAPIEELAQ